MNNSPITQQTQILLTIAIAIIILVSISLVSWLTSFNSPTPVVEGGTTTPEMWPPPPPTFTSTPIPTGTTVPTITPSPTPITVGWHELGYLTSIEYTLQTAVEIEREQEDGLFNELFGRDRIVLLAVGNVEAGIDMTQIEESDIEIDGTQVSIQLPPAVITSIELLPGETQIFDSERKWFLSEYNGLEVEALDKARTQLESWAINQSHILSLAEKLAISQLESFLRQLGFEEITITIKN